MGKASSNKKVARAKKAAGRPGAKKSYGWPLTIGAVTLAGVLLVLLSLGSGSEARDPRIGDHWHAAYGIYDCDDFLPPLVDVVSEAAGSGIHTHRDGLIHMHPINTRYTGDGANLTAFGEMTGMELTDSSLSVEGMGLSRENGDDCGGEPGVVQLVVWDNPSAETPRLITEDIRRYAPQNGEVLTIAFAPEGAEIPRPPSIVNLADPTAAEEGRTPVSTPESPELEGDDPAPDDPDAPDVDPSEQTDPGADPDADDTTDPEDAGTP